MATDPTSLTMFCCPSSAFRMYTPPLALTFEAPTDPTDTPSTEEGHSFSWTVGVPLPHPKPIPAATEPPVKTRVASGVPWVRAVPATRGTTARARTIRPT